MISIRTASTKVVVIGNGMVGQRFCELLCENMRAQKFSLTVFGEETRPAYDRVNLTKYLTADKPDELTLASSTWCADNDITLHLGDPVTDIDRTHKIIRSATGREVAYDVLILGMGSSAFVPEMPGVDKKGVFVYRTLDDLDAIRNYAKSCSDATVLGGGLLGLEAAKAIDALGVPCRVVDKNQHLMARQLDACGGAMLQEKITDLGITVELSRHSQTILGNGKVTGIRFHEGEDIKTEMVIVAAGIRPRDELARSCGLAVHERGGVVVDDQLTTSDPSVYAIGEVAAHAGQAYGLVAPGYAMAEVVAKNLCGGAAEFTGADTSTKLKLLGVEVANFGRTEVISGETRAVVFHDPEGGIYKKLVFTANGETLVGGILVGDTSAYAEYLQAVRAATVFSAGPAALLGGASGGEDDSASELDDSALVCSCNNVTKKDICAAIREHNLTTVDEVKRCTRAGAGCGGCLPLVTKILNTEIAKAGGQVKQDLCEHFAYSRRELLEIIKIKKLRNFPAVLNEVGNGHGCEICKPTVASIIASLWNEPICHSEHAVIQDTNDRFLANIQRQGSYSVIPRIPGGEITPEKLIEIGQIAKKYNLYLKITGGQRLALFGARVEQLPDIWEELITAGFESGHAYGKALRTVKSCVGASWCRFGVQDSVDFAIAIENRYKGIRSPHKLKSAVSGCMRECAEAKSKDFGIIATDAGWNLYVGGNGGANPRHAELLAANVDRETCLRYIDRFLMYYIHTADKLMRTSAWVESLPEGIETVREVVVEDSLGIGEQLEQDMARLIDSFRCEWEEVVNSKRKRARFQHFVNDSGGDPAINFVTKRGQYQPTAWPQENENEGGESVTSTSRELVGA